MLKNYQENTNNKKKEISYTCLLAIKFKINMPIEPRHENLKLTFENALTKVTWELLHRAD